MRALSSRKIASWILLAFIHVLVPACSASTEDVSTKVCSIYSDMQKFNEKSIGEREGILTSMVQDKMPVFFEENFQYFMQVDWDDKADTMERLLGMIEEDDQYVLCDPIRDYYSVSAVSSDGSNKS